MISTFNKDFADILAEIDSDAVTPAEVAEAFVAELDGWADYHKKQFDFYEAIRVALGERVPQA